MMKKKYRLVCFSCRKSLKNVHDNSNYQPFDGLAFVTHGHYGSTYFDPMDGSSLNICICDDCLKIGDNLITRGYNI